MNGLIDLSPLYFVPVTVHSTVALICAMADELSIRSVARNTRRDVVFMGINEMIGGIDMKLNLKWVNLLKSGFK
jgi:hypothetical protein